MTTVVFHFTDWDDYPGGNLPKSIMSVWVHNVRAFGADRIIMIDKTRFKIGLYYEHSDDSILFERFETLEECMDAYPNDSWVFIELNEDSVNVNTFTHPENCFYVVGADFSSLLCTKQPTHWVRIPMIQHRPLYSHVAMMTVLYDRFIKTL